MFVNRETELSVFQQAFSQNVPIRALVLVGPHGIGKSAFAEQLLTRLTDFVTVKVRVLQSRSKYGENGHYLRLIGRSFDEAAAIAPELPTFRAFVRSIHSPTVRTGIARAIVRDVASVIGGSRTLGVVEQAMGTGEHSDRRVFETHSSEVLTAIGSYVEHCAGLKRTVINVENAHTIDDASLGFLCRLLRDVPTVHLLLEYTNEPHEGWALSSLTDYLGTSGADVRVAVLTKLAAKDALCIAGAAKGQLERFVRNAYEASDGNLRPLTDLAVQLDLNGGSTNRLVAAGTTVLEQSMTLNIRSLQAADILVLAAVVVHGSAVHRDSLDGLHSYRPSSGLVIDVDDSLRRLVDQCLVTSEGNRLEPAHDLVIAAIEEGSDFTKHRLIALDFWRAFYDRVLEDDNFFVPRSEALSNLLYVCSRLDDVDRVIDLLSLIGRCAVISSSPRRVLDLLDNIRERVGQSARGREIARSIGLGLLDLAYAAGHFDFAWKVLASIENDSPRLVVYRAALLDLIDRQEEAIAFVRALLESDDTRADPSLRPCLRLIELSALRGTNQHAECSSLYREIIDRALVPPSVPEYGTFLRAAELALPPSQAIPYVEQSIEFFEERGASVECGRARIALSLQFGDLGWLSEATAQLDAAETLLQDQAVERHTLLNNHAALRLQRGLHDDETADLLGHALGSAGGAFERLVILINSLILADRRGDIGRANHLVERIEAQLNTPRPRDLEIRRIALYNVSVFYRHQGLPNLARKYITAAAELRLDLNAEYWAARLTGAPCSDPDFTFRLTKDFYPAFLTYWHLDIGKHLACW